METPELAAREQIRDLVARYNANGDSGRIEPLLNLFCENAELEVDGETYVGLVAVREFFADVTSRSRAQQVVAYIRHFTATHQIDMVSPTRATGRCYYQTLTDRGLDHWGRYLDEYRLVGDRWMFGRRTVTLDGCVAGGWAERMMAGHSVAKSAKSS
jgi:hypothetical protein